MKRAVVALFAGSALVLTGCSGDSEGTATPDPDLAGGSSSAAPSSEEAGGNSDLPHSGAPNVDNPLPESVLAGDPCGALDREQVKEALGETASGGQRRDEPALGPRCRWKNPDTLGSFVVSYHTVVREGLSAVYANSQPQVEVFNEAGPVEGFPAVAYKGKRDDPTCVVVVGIANEYAVGATVSLSTDKESEGADPCEPAEWVAGQVVGKLKADA